MGGGGGPGGGPGGMGGNVMAAMVTSTVLGSWGEMLQERVKLWRLDPEEMIKEFGEVRDRWIAEEEDKWIARNRAYDLVPDCIDAMLDAGAEVFIITTKQRRFCEALLKDFQLDLPSEKVFALEDGPKTDVLKSLLAKPELAGRTFHFIEDKLGTLRKVAKDAELESVKLHLADWGYVTARERKIVGAGVVDKVSLLSMPGLEVLGIGRPWME
mmetsp:Transcript_4469/g.13361  ORF Transcript_4469/g.13361 Transcript_4469/m.13361 type:complete len:213 (-) Transcript_4469:52-690(-)